MAQCVADARVPQDALLRVDPLGTGDLDPPFHMDSMLPLSDQPLEAILMDVNDLTNSLVRGTRVPDRLMRGVYELATGYVGLRFACAHCSMVCSRTWVAQRCKPARGCHREGRAVPVCMGRGTG